MSKLFGALLTFCLVATAYGQKNGPLRNLYEAINDPYVIELNNSTFDNEIHCIGKNFSECSSYVVEFYTSASKLCSDYALTYSSAAAKASYWKKKIVKFAAVNCHQPANEPLCKLHGFQRMPLLKYFQRNSPIGDMGELFETNLQSDHILQRVTEKINNEYWVKAHDDWPNFNELPDFANLTEIWNTVDECTNSYLIVLVDNSSDWVGATILTEAYDVADKSLPIRRANKKHEIVKLINESNIVFPEPLMLYRRPTGADCTALNVTQPIGFSKITVLRGVGDTKAYKKEYYDGQLTIERREPTKTFG